MSSELINGLHQKFIGWSKILSLTVIIVGSLVLTGWQFNIEILKRPIPQLVAMNPLTAILFIMSGLCIFLRIRSEKKQLKSSHLNLLALFVFLIASVKFISIFIAPNFPIDTFLFASKVHDEVFGINRMAPNTSFNFFLTGSSLLIMSYRKNGNKIAEQVIALIILLIGILSLLGYIYHVDSFYGIRTFIPMAVHTAITFIILSLSILFLHPDQGIMQHFTSNHSGSTSARFLIPAAIFIPALLGYLRLLGDWGGLYSKEFGVAILILSTIIIFLILIGYNASILNKKDALRKIAEENLKALNFDLESEVRSKTKAVIRNEKRFQSMIENSADIISLRGEYYEVIYINPAIERVTGYSPEEIKKIGYLDLVHPDHVDEEKELNKKIIANPGMPFTRVIRLIHKNGNTIWTKITSINMLNDVNVKAIISNYIDITDNKMAEEKLKKSEKLFRSIALNIPRSFVMVFDKDHKFVMVEGEMMERMGYKQQDYEGKHPLDVLPKENYERSKPLYDRVFKGEQFSVEHDSERGQYIVHFVPIKDDNGSVELGMILALDVTEIKKAQNEIAELNRDLEKKVYERTEQLESVNKELESFSYSVSHDLRAPLRAINGYAKMIEEDYEDKLDSEGNRLLKTVQYNAQRMGTLIDDLLSFSRLGRKDLNKAELDIKELVEGAIHEINKTMEHNAEIKVEKLDNSKGDYSLITQVFFNLIANAIKYSSKKEKPVIKISSEIKGNEVVYCVADNGVGFEMKYANKLFGVFQRLHATEDFEGTGVGLAIVQRIINKHGGKVWADAKIDEGASFYFSLPLN